VFFLYKTHGKFKQWFLTNYWYWQKLIYRELVEVVYSATFWKFSGRIENVFSLQIHAEKILTISRLTPNMRRYTDCQSVSVCEVVSKGRYPYVHKNCAFTVLEQWLRSHFVWFSAVSSSRHFMLDTDSYVFDRIKTPVEKITISNRLYFVW